MIGNIGIKNKKSNLDEAKREKKEKKETLATKKLALLQFRQSLEADKTFRRKNCGRNIPVMGNGNTKCDNL